MTHDSFIRKWKANKRNERAAAQEHFIDLCRLMSPSAIAAIIASPPYSGAD